jgi:hypothetical protein
MFFGAVHSDQTTTTFFPPAGAGLASWAFAIADSANPPAPAAAPI